MAADQVLRRLVLALVLLVLTVLSLVYMEDVTGSLRHVIGSPALPPGRQSRATISGLVQPASAVRCNRITLPSQYYNESTGPYNPAAVRHPTSGEWYLFHTYDEVGARRAAGRGARAPAQGGLLCSAAWGLSVRNAEPYGKLDSQQWMRW